MQEATSSLGKDRAGSPVSGRWINVWILVLLGGLGSACTPATPEDRGKTLLRAVVAAAGGAEKLAALRSLQWTASEIRDPNGQKLERELKATVVFPGSMRIDWNDGKSVTRFAVSGERGWQKGPRGDAEFPLSQVNDLKNSLLLSTTPLLMSAKDLQAVELEPTEFNGKQYRQLLVIRGDLPSVTFHIDPDTHRIFHRKTIVQETTGAVLREEVLTDYREVEGVWFAFARVIYQKGEETTRLTIRGYKLNPAVDPLIFSQPEANQP